MVEKLLTGLFWQIKKNDCSIKKRSIFEQKKVRKRECKIWNYGKGFTFILQKGYNQTSVTNEDHNASDVYGGVTLNQIKGKWGHHKNSYWIHTDSLERKREPNREGFASYYGSMMLENGDFRDKQIASLDEYLPNSKENMEEIFEQMNEGGNEWKENRPITF